MSVGSTGSVLSVGSVASFASFGSLGSAMSLLSLGSFQARWSVLSGQSDRSVLSWQTQARVRGYQAQGPAETVLRRPGLMPAAAGTAVALAGVGWYVLSRPDPGKFGARLCQARHPMRW
jgi:hypothetical protein